MNCARSACRWRWTFPASARTCKTTSTSTSSSARRARSRSTVRAAAWLRSRWPYNSCCSGPGPGTSNVAEAGAFGLSGLGAATPDIQYHFIPAQVVNHARTPMDGDGVTLHACCLRPQSRGEIRLASSDPLAPPVMDPNYLAADYDLKILIEGLRQGREILAAPAFKPWLAEERLPGAVTQSDAELEEFIRATAETEYHPVGTCKMGSNPMAVVDERLRVRGIERLRVVDASIMPALISGNTNAPVIMVAEKASEMMLAEKPAN